VDFAHRFGPTHPGFPVQVGGVEQLQGTHETTQEIGEVGPPALVAGIEPFGITILLSPH
jgi:hypothetical protein